MTGPKPWYKKPLVVVGLVLVVVLLLSLVYSYGKSQAATPIAAQQPQPTTQSADAKLSQTAVYQAPTDSSAQDAEAEDKVNFARLKLFINKIQDQPADTASLDAAINQIISANPDLTFGVSINYLNTGQTHNYGSTKAMTAASVTKLLTAVDYYKQVELGKKSLSAVMANGKTAEYNIEQMIVVSNNDSWHLLNESLTYSQLQSYAEGIGLTTYDSGDNAISASDVTKLLKDMYQRKLINETHVQQLLGYMERANYRDLVTPAVPATDTVYHKAGEYNGYLHDATIITNETDAVVLTIFTQSHSSYSKSRNASLMQEITTPTLETFHLN